jgi:phage major head subunit gpT-like protein
MKEEIMERFITRVMGHAALALILMCTMVVGLPALAGALSVPGAESVGAAPVEQDGGTGLWLMLSLLAIGGVVTSDFLTAVFTGFKALFTTGFAAIRPQWTRVAMEAPSTTDGETYNWLGAVPAMKEWIDTKIAAGLSAFNYTIRNKDWESTIEVDRNTFEDDKLGMVNPRIQELSQEAARHPDELISSLITTNGLCYDGQNFFDTDHSEGASGTQVNTAAGTGVTTALLTADFRTARAAMINVKDDRGKPMIKNLGQDAMGAPNGMWLVMCPPALMGTFEELMNASFISNTENVLKGAFSLWVNPYLTDANDWYLFYVGSAVRPLIMQMRKRPVFVSLQDPNSSESVFFRKKFYFGVEARYNAGYGLWQFAYRTTNT